MWPDGFFVIVKVQAAAVISSYAEPLLAGCGTIQEGELRVVGVSREVPFVTAFVNAELPQPLRDSITRILLETGQDADLLKALESAGGFMPFDESDSPAGAVSGESSTAAKKKQP